MNVMNCIFKLMSAIKGRICCEWASIENMACHAPTLEIVMMLVSEVAVKLCTKLSFNGENYVLLCPSSLLVQEIFLPSLLNHWEENQRQQKLS